VHQLACAALDAFLAALKKAYEKIGFAPTAELAAAGLKRVIVSDDGQSKFVPVHDSDNAMIDSGQLKELAVVLSKRLKSVAVLTSVYDSDHFEFIVFHNGKQVDAAVSDPDDHSGGLKILSAKRRAATWANLFLTPDLLRSLQRSASTATFDPSSIADKQRAFEQGLARANGGRLCGGRPRGLVRGGWPCCLASSVRIRGSVDGEDRPRAGRDRPLGMASRIRSLRTL
jgi:hypothetical protein